MAVETRAADGKAPDSGLSSLYQIGGWAALLVPVIYLGALIVNVLGYRAAPFPETIVEWFGVFQDNWLVGLVFLGLADILITLVSIPMFLALYSALKRVNKSWMIIAAAFALVAIAVYLATNTAFSMLALSRQYAAAAAEVQRSQFLAAGQALIAISRGTGAHYLGLPLMWVASLIISAVMLRSQDFGRAAAYVGIVGFPLLLASIPFVGYTTVDPLTPVESAIVAVSYAGGGVLSLVWYVLTGLRLLKLGRPPTE